MEEIIEKRKQFLDPVKDTRADRDKYSVSLRHKKRQEIFKAKRMNKMIEETKSETTPASDDPNAGEISEPKSISKERPSVKFKNILIQHVPIIYETNAKQTDVLNKLKEALEAEDLDTDTYLALLSATRELLCTTNLNDFEIVIDSGLYDILMKYASVAMEHEDLMYEITWILTNITSSTNSKVIKYIVSESEFFEFLDGLLTTSKSEKIKEHALWCFANLMSDNDELISKSLQTSLFDTLKAISQQQSAKIGMLRTAAWCMANIMKLKVKKKLFIEESIDILSTFLFLQDYSIQSDTLVSFMNLLKIEEEDELRIHKVEYIVSTGIMNKFHSLLADSDKNIAMTSCRVLGFLVSNDSKMVDTSVGNLIDFEVVQELIESSKSWDGSLKEVLWFISNIVTIKSKGIQELFYESEVLKTVLTIMDTRSCDDVWREAMWVVSNFIDAADEETRIRSIRDYKLPSKFVSFIQLASGNPRIVTTMLVVVDKLLEVYKYFPNSENDPRVLFEEAGGIELCEQLQTSVNVDVYSLSKKLLETYYPGDDDVVEIPPPSDEQKKQLEF